MAMGQMAKGQMAKLVTMPVVVRVLCPAACSVGGIVFAMP